MRQKSGLWMMLIVSLLLLLAGCGGGGDGGGFVVGGASTVSGVAAAGAPLVGTVYLKDSSSPAKQLSDTIGADGSFSFDVDGLKAPFILKAQGTSGGTSYTLYSFAPGPGIANINPFANLAVANAAGSADLAALYATPSATTMQTIATNIAKAEADIQTKLQPLFTLYGATSNPVSGSYTVNHLGLDGVLDMVKVDLSTGGTVILTNKLTNAVICTGSVSNIAGWTLDQTKIPLPPVVVSITPETPTVRISGTATFTASVYNSTNKRVTWSVVETGGGTITSAGVYTAPATIGTATTKTFTVKATSVADPAKYDTVAVTVTTGPVVKITPTSATVGLYGTTAFTATVTGAFINNQVSWSVVEPGGGWVTQTGVYTAPATIGTATTKTFTVKATSVEDPTRSATATVTVRGAVVTISPTSASVTTGGTKTFSATVTGISNTQVTWSVVEAGGGSVTQTGVYTAPAAGGTYHVRATSVADPTKSATATVTVTALPQPFPLGTWTGPNGFSFTVTKLVVGGLVPQYAGVIYYPSLVGGSLNVSGTDSLIQIIGNSNGSLQIGGGQVSGFNYTTIEMGLYPVSDTTAKTFYGYLSISSSNTAYNYLNTNATFTRQ